MKVAYLWQKQELKWNMKLFNGKIRLSNKPKTIYRSGDEPGTQEPYLIRYNLLSTPWFGIKIHKILLSDSDCLHDHPWTFISLILKGGYFETTTKQYKKSQIRFAGHKMPAGQRFQWVTWRGPGSILYRPAAMAHRLDLKKDKGGHGDPIPALTFVINLKREREWGFWTPLGWLHWEKYTSVNKCE